MIRGVARIATLALGLLVAAAVAPTTAQEQKGTLIFAVESLGAQTLDPILEGRPGNAVYQAVMYDSLVGFNFEKGGVGPGVAERWELSPDGLSWTFFIRPGQVFHNGDKLTAHDVKFSLERQMSQGSLAAAAATMRRTIKSIEVVNELTVQVNTNSPQIGLPAGLSRAVAPEGAIMPKNYIEKVGDEEYRKNPIGSGPWKFKRNVKGDRIEFEAVTHNHWRGRPHFKELHILLVPEESTRVAMVRTGEAAIASIGPETMLSAARAGLEVLSVPGTMQAIFQFYGAYKPENKDLPIAKPRVRQALSLAIDRKQIIEHVMNGKARMPHPFATFAYTDFFSAAKWEKWANENYRYDPALAKKILAEEGYPNGFELKFANTALPGTQFMVDIGTALADMWTKIGVKVTLKHYEWGSFAPLERGDQAQLLGWASMYRTAGRPDAPWRYDGAFSPESTQRLLGHKEHCGDICQEYVKTYRALIAELDREKRTALTDKMVEIVANSWTVIPIIEGMGYYAINTRKVGQFAPIAGRHELGDVFERVPRPEQKAWPKK
ncbi:MAG: ABC transporter substrate-binding protein [Alphaproteobacteria bacterium]|nr:ABC transporter substrate-binding protein [Alphaproteobacteria bacterium]